MAADEFGEKFEEDGKRDADTQHPQGFHRFVRDDAVIDVHHVERAHQREEVDEEGGDDDLVVVAAEAPDDAPEPAFRQFVFGQFGTHVFFGFGLDEPGVAEVLALQVGKGDAPLAHTSKFHQCFVPFDFFQHGSFVVAQHDDSGQSQVGDFAQRTLLQIVVKALVFQHFRQFAEIKIADLVARS